MPQGRPSAPSFIKKEAPTQVFSCDYCKISKNKFFYRTPPVAASKVQATTVVLMKPTSLQSGTRK